MEPDKRPTGPSLETYVETRMNLLQVSIDKMEASLRERVDAVEAASIARKDHLASEIEHGKKMLSTAQDNAKLQADDAKKTQHDINVASNEWRATLTDFRSSVPTKDELNRFYSEFVAYKLENEKRLAAATGERSAKSESKDDWRGNAALIVAIAAVIVAYLVKQS